MATITQLKRNVPPVAKGLVFAAVAVAVQIIAVPFLIRPLFDLSWGATAAITIGGAALFAPYGFFVGWKELYAFSPRTIWAFTLDVSWSGINTVTGFFWLVWCAAKGTLRTDCDEAKHRGICVYQDVALPGAVASTLGPVIGGTWLLHEAVHVQQARIFGPFYWPVYLLSYASAMIARLITGRFRDPHWEAYERVVMEDWAYRAAPGLATKLNVKTSILWFFIALLNAVAVGVLIAPIPGVGALPALIGLKAIPWWTGLVVMVLYALFRSVFPKARFDSWQLSFKT
jgi:hypothetical protein